MGIELGHLNTIRANHPGDVGGCCKDLWKKWLEMDPNATWDKLFTAINDCAATSASTSTSTYPQIVYARAINTFMLVL